MAVNTKRQPLDRFFDGSPDLMCVVGYDGYFKHVNPAWTQLLGWVQAELLDHPALGIVHPSDHPRLKAARTVVQEGGHPHRIEIRYVHKDGSYRWIWWNVFPQPEEKIIYAIGRDITEEKKHEVFSDSRAIVVPAAEIGWQFSGATKFGLTRTETKVTAFIMRGYSAKEAALKLGMSYNTIKVHLRHVFEKVGVRTQRALISLMFSIHESNR